MAVGTGYSKISTSGLTFCYDVGDTNLSYLGRPTSNALADAGLSIYNNVGGDVSITLTQTSDTYRGASVWKEVMTPTTASGVNYLTNANNPGIGIVTGGGGGTANRYTGHSIFFRPTVPMAGCPCFTHYSNIGGWQSSCDIQDMGDGWFRAKVIWYDTVTRSDGKYWAINPASATLNVPITVYWAGPFKEDLNSSTISQFTNSSRSVTNSLRDLTKNYTIDLTNMSYDSSANLTFDGSSNYIPSIGSAVVGAGSSAYTVSVWVYRNRNNVGYEELLAQWTNANSGNSFFFGFNNSNVRFTDSWSDVTVSGAGNTGVWMNLVGVNTGSNAYIYLNGNLMATKGSALSYTGTGPMLFGRQGSLSGEYFSGKMNAVYIYNRALNETEIKQNYNHNKTRFGLT